MVNCKDAIVFLFTYVRVCWSWQTHYENVLQIVTRTEIVIADVALAPATTRRDQDPETAGQGLEARTRSELYPNPAVGHHPETKLSPVVGNPRCTGMCLPQDLNMCPQHNIKPCKVSSPELFCRFRMVITNNIQICCILLFVTLFIISTLFHLYFQPKLKHNQ